MRTLLCALLLGAALPAQATLFTGGTLWTGDGDEPVLGALLVVGDTIAALGDAAFLKTLPAANGASVVDCTGRTVLPGIVDAHVHALMGGDELLAPDLRSARTEREFAERLAAAAAKLPAGTWLTGGAWDHENWPGGALPTKALLDELVPAHPVFVRRLDGHMAVCNSLALQKGVVTRASKDPPGGTIVRDADGEPTGVLKDEAMALVQARVPPWHAAQRRERLLAALRHAAALGVTSMHDMLDSWDALAAWQQLRDEGLLTCRITVYTPLADVGRWAAVRVRSGFGDDWLRLGGCKGFADGSLGSTTAWFFAPYDDAPHTSGLPMPEMASDGMQELLAQCAHLGLQPAVHAIGDRANAAMLDLFAAAKDLRRPRIEHAQHLRPADVARFAGLGVIASMQPYHAIDDGRWAEKRIGRERCQTTYAFAGLHAAGAVLAFGSDWPVAPLSPWLGLDAAVHRRTLDGRHPDGWVPGQRIPLSVALRAYTMGSAFAGGQETRLGRLARGMLADLVVVDGDLFAAGAALERTQVVLTMVGGRVVFRR